MVALSGLSAADACLLNEASFPGNVILGSFWEKFLEARLLKLVLWTGSCSARDVVLRIPGLFAAKGLVDVKKGFMFSTAPPAA